MVNNREPWVACLQGDVGSVVKTDEDDDPIAIMTVLNTTKYKDAAWLKQLREFLAARCPKGQGLPQKLEQVRTGRSTTPRVHAHTKQALMVDVGDVRTVRHGLFFVS